MNPNETPVAASTAPMSRARKVMLWGLGLAFFALFLKYTTATVNIQLWAPPGMYSVSAPVSNTATGFQYKPWAGWIVAGLLAVFGTSMHQSPFWRRYGYWLAFVLLFCFTPWPDGLVPFIAWITVGVAAFMNGRELKTQQA